MKLTPEHARVIANAEPFTTILRDLLQSLAPLMRSLAVAPARRRARLVTRRKQRRQW